MADPARIARRAFAVLLPVALVAAGGSVVVASVDRAGAAAEQSTRPIAPFVARTAPGGPVRLPDGRFVFSDFSPSLIGVDLGGSRTGLVGEGSHRTRVLMTSRTSSKASEVPTAPWSTNQLYLLSVLGGSPTLAGFTLRGTDQGHLYNGLRVGRTTSARVRDVRVVAVPGDDDIPPGETFGINDYRTTGSRYTDVVVAGRGIGASGFATNGSTGVTVDGGDFHDERNAGAAFWQTHDVTLTDVRVARNRTGLNFERVTGTVRIVRPVFEGNTGQDAYFGTDRASARVVIVDPVFSGRKLRIQVPKRYMGGAATQLRSDVHVVIGGVDRTAQVVHWVGR